MPLTTAGRNAVLDSGIPAITHVGALTALTGTEVAGGSYARQSISHAAAASGVKDNSAQITIPIPAGTTVVAVSEYDASSAGNQLSYGGIGSTVKGVGTAATTDTITSNGHGLVDNDRVFVWAVNGESLPTGLAASTLYHVISSASNTFQLSTSQGGAAVDITAVGELAFAKTVPETFASAGNLVFAAGALDHDATFG
jgi:hypothetical protein